MSKKLAIVRLLMAGFSLLLMLSCLPEKQNEQAVPSAKAQMDKAAAAADAANEAAARTDELSGAIDGTGDEQEEDDADEDGER